MDMKIKGVYLLVQLDNDGIHQALLTEDQEAAIKSVLSIIGSPLKIIEKPLELETYTPENK
jgi:hypothetical protein